MQNRQKGALIYSECDPHIQILLHAAQSRTFLTQRRAARTQNLSSPRNQTFLAAQPEPSSPRNQNLPRLTTKTQNPEPSLAAQPNLPRRATKTFLTAQPQPSS
jgi:hypothetical protein